MSEMEERLTRDRGVTRAFAKYGRKIWDEYTKGSVGEEAKEEVETGHGGGDSGRCLRGIGEKSRLQRRGD